MNNDALRAAADGVTIPPESLAVITEALKNYSGDVSVFESAVGAFIMAHYLGVDPLRIMHSPVSMKKWAVILDIDWDDMEVVGPLAERSNGYRWARKLEHFKQAVRGNVSVPDRRTLTVSGESATL